MNIQKNRRAVDSRHLSTKMEPNCERARKCSAVRPGGQYHCTPLVLLSINKNDNININIG